MKNEERKVKNSVIARAKPEAIQDSKHGLLRLRLAMTDNK